MIKKLFVLAIAFLIGSMSLTTFAADQAAQEETTPPPAEGAITLEQIPPIDSAKKTSPSPATAPLSTEQK